MVGGVTITTGGTVTLSNVAFSNDSATGGAGGHGATSASSANDHDGGGGGGLGGADGQNAAEFTGGSGGFGGAGGGAGLGGALFVAGTNVVGGVTITTGGTVTLENVAFTNDSATGGAGGHGATSASSAYQHDGGGGGGLGGAGGAGHTWGGGGGAGAAGATNGGNADRGILKGASGGGGGSSGSGGSSGGASAGGGGSAHIAQGAGGGGADGKTATNSNTGGSGGFGGGGGGGGLGAGGDVFVQHGGVLLIEGGGSLAAGGVQAGAGGALGTDGGSGRTGDAFGNDIFIEGTHSVTLEPQTGQTLTIGGVIADETGSDPTAASQGSGGLIVNGPGTVVLEAVNTYTGPTTIGNGGRLALHGTGSIAHSAVTLDAGVLDISGASGTEHLAGLTSDSAGTIALGSHTLIVDGGGTYIFAGTVTGTRAIGIGGGGTLDLLSATLPAQPSFAFAGGGKILEASTIPALSGFGLGDTLDIRTLDFGGIGGENTAYAGGLLTLSTGGGGGLATLHIPGPYTSSNFQAASDGSGGVAITTNTAVVSDEAGLNNAIAAFDSITAAGVYTIDLSGTITEGTDTGGGLPADLYAINNVSPGVSLVIDGAAAARWTAPGCIAACSSMAAPSRSRT